MIMNSEGNGSISLIIIMMFILVTIVLPLTSIVFENYYVSIISREIVDASYSSMSSTFDSINIGRSSRKKLEHGTEIEDKFKEFLKYNLSLDDELKSQNEKFLELEIIRFSNLSSGEIDLLSGEIMKRQTIHIEMRAFFKAMFLMSDVDDKRTVDIHFDYELPIDN